jgi:putative tryptophan/tyrosine transport system substrate-binding protein
MLDLRRREFITLLGGAAVAWPLAARAQMPVGMHHLGMLMGYTETDREGQAFVAAFREALAKLGWAEGRTIQMDVRWAPPAAMRTYDGNWRRNSLRPSPT